MLGVKVRAKRFNYDGVRLASREGRAWNVFVEPKRGITVNFESPDSDSFEEIRITEAKLAELGFVPVVTD